MNSPASVTDRLPRFRPSWPRRLLTWLAGGAILLGLLILARGPAPLTPEEQTLLGTWTYRDADEPNFQRTFTADRRFREVIRSKPGSISCGGVPTGIWRIRGGKLFLTRDPFPLSIPSWSIAGIWGGLRDRWIESRAERYSLVRLDPDEVELDGLPYRRLPMPVSQAD
jgi:hypothetical protein